MQRRGFLGALMGLAAAPVLAKLAPAIVVPESTIILPTIEVPRGIGMAHTLDFTNPTVVAQVIELRRAVWSDTWGGYPLLLRCALGPHGVVCWRAPPDSCLEVVFTPEQPVVALLPVGCQGCMSYTLDGEPWVRHFLPDGSVWDLPARKGVTT